MTTPAAGTVQSQPAPVAVAGQTQDTATPDAPQFNEADFAVGNEGTTPQPLEAGNMPGDGTGELDYKQLYEQSEQNRRSLQGMFSNMQTTITNLQSQIDQRNTPAAGDKKVEPFKLEDVEGLTEDERASLGKLSGTIEKLIKNVVTQTADPLVQQLNTLNGRIDETNGKFGEFGNRIDTVHSSTYAANLSAAVPDMATLMQDQKFQAYLRQVAPMSGGKSISEILKSAHEAKDLNTIQEVVGTFRQQTGGKAPQPQDFSTAKVTPAEPQRVDQGAGGDKPMLAYSHYQAASEEVKKHPNDPKVLAKYNEITKMYERAQSEGRVDYQK